MKVSIGVFIIMLMVYVLIRWLICVLLIDRLWLIFSIRFMFVNLLVLIVKLFSDSVSRMKVCLCGVRCVVRERVGEFIG